MTKRVLVIEKLVVAIPDDFESKDHPGSEELTINDALRFLLDYRQTPSAVMENRFGNFEFTSLDFPKDTVPEGLGSETFTKEKLLSYLSEHPEKAAVGAMYSLYFDQELGGYRNCYRGAECDEFNAKKQFVLDYYANKKAEDPDKDTPCENCDNICDENCPEERSPDVEVDE